MVFEEKSPWAQHRHSVRMYNVWSFIGARACTSLECIGCASSMRKLMQHKQRRLCLFESRFWIPHQCSESMVQSTPCDSLFIPSKPPHRWISRLRPISDAFDTMEVSNAEGPDLRSPREEPVWWILIIVHEELRGCQKRTLRHLGGEKKALSVGCGYGKGTVPGE